jgi:hypothetical protein
MPNECMKEFESKKIRVRPSTVGWNVGSVKKGGSSVNVRVRARTSSVGEGDLVGNRYRQAGSVRGGPGKLGWCSGSFKWGGGGVMWAKGRPKLAVQQGYVVSHRLL